MSLQDRLTEAAPPDAEGAEQRAWALVRTAVPPPRPRRRPARWMALAAAAVLLAAVGAAAAGRPGEAVADWVRRTIAPPPARPAPVPAARAGLPGGGAVLATGRAGTVLLGRGGKARGLGRYTAAAFSPRGRFVVAFRGRTLTALDLHGRVRWRLQAPGTIRSAAWSPDGFRIAYFADGAGVRVVAGDGTGDHPYGLRATSPLVAWRPGWPHTLATVDRRGRIDVRDVDTGELILLTGAPIGRGVRALAWSADGRRLAVARAQRLVLLDFGGGLPARPRLPAGWRAADVAWSPRRAALAVVLRSPSGRLSQIAVLTGAALRRGRADAFAAAERLRWPILLAGVEWSPDGRWLLADWPGPRQWLLVRAEGAPRVSVLRAPRALGPAPGVEGWR